MNAKYILVRFDCEIVARRANLQICEQGRNYTFNN